MRNKEAAESLTLAIQITMFSIVCIFFFYLTNITKNMYQTKSDQDALKEYIETESDKYFFQYSEHIFGTDLIAYIIQYDATHDYYITLNDGRSYLITKEHAKELREEGKDGNIIWSQDYLTNIVFIDKVFSEFLVTTSENWDGSINYYIDEK